MDAPRRGAMIAKQKVNIPRPEREEVIRI